jgi:hypothetical protein
MHVRRGLLFWGLLLIPLGGIPLIVRAGGIDARWLVDAWRLWPLALIGAGLAVLIGRTRASVVGTAVIALTLGSIGGAILAAPDTLIGAVTDCMPTGPTQSVQRDGTFADDASVVLDLRCGSVDLTAGDEARWDLDAGYRESPPVVESSGDRLVVRSASGAPAHDEWSVRLPAVQLNELDIQANAATASADLGEAALNRLVADLNAGDLRLDASDSPIDRLDVTMNAGRIRIEAGSSISGAISVNAGAIDLCVPQNVGLRLDVTEQLTFATNLGSKGLSQSGSTWIRPAADGAPTVDLDLSGNAASLTLKPEGGCS